MADKKKVVELDPTKDVPQYLYQITQEFMLGYIKQKKISNEDRKWFKELCLENKKEVTRGNSTFTVLDISPVRKGFAEKFFSDIEFGKKPKKPSFFDELDSLDID